MTTSAERERILAARLASSSVLGSLDDAERRALARIAVRRNLRKRQRLYARGEAGDALVLVLTGRLEVVLEQRALRSLGVDALVGLSTLAGVAHSADIVAAEPTEVLLVPGAAVRALFGRRPELPLKIVEALAALVANLSDDVVQLRTADILERTRRKVEQLARGRREVAITHAELARLVGASRANTSRALSKLEAAGVLRRGRGRLIL